MSDLFSSIANAAKTITTNTTIRQFTDTLQGMALNLAPVEQCVWDATNEEPWGPTGPQMKEVCNFTYQYDQFFSVVNTLYKRMLENNKNAWRRVYKSLVLLNYLLQHGSERVVSSAKDNLFHIRALENYKFIDEKGKDQGINIRHRAKIIVDLLQDDDKLRAERKKAKGDSKEKYQGYTSDDIRMGRGGSYNQKNEKSRYDDDDDFDKPSDRRKYSWEDAGDEQDKKSKEVSAFKFDGGSRRRESSPELGFRDEGSRKKTDDDEFGEFTSARGTTAANTSAQPTKSLGRISVPGGSVAKSAPTVQKQHVAPPPAAVGFDLLGGFDAPATGGSTPAVDLFADPVPSSIPQINTAALRPPRPPSGGSAASNGFSPSQPANLLDDVFGSPVSAAPPANNYSQMSMDPFGSLPSQPSPQQAVQPSFADFGAPVAAPVNNTSSMNQGSLLNDDFFGGLTLQPTNTANQFGFQATGSQPQTSQKSPTPAKVGSTWSGTTGLIDLNNLGNKNPSKKVHVPMNQMGSRNL